MLLRVITLDIQDDKIYDLEKEVKRLRYPFASLGMNFVDESIIKGKKIISSAIGKVKLYHKFPINIVTTCNNL